MGPKSDLICSPEKENQEGSRFMPLQGFAGELLQIIEIRRRAVAFEIVQSDSVEIDSTAVGI